MTTIFLKPKAGARVMNPDQNPPQPLPPGGLRVDDSQYWRRRIQEGVVEITTPPNQGKALDPQSGETAKAEREGLAETSKKVKH